MDESPRRGIAALNPAQDPVFKGALPKVNPFGAIGEPLPTVSSAPQPVQVVKPVPKPVSLTEGPSPVRGFSSRKEFRDLTRPLAQKHRGATVIISGSSVTGESFKTGKPFGSHSDIDIGLIDPQLSKSRQVDYRGFPAYGSPLSKEEKRLQKSFRQHKGRKTGIKVFSEEPNREFYVRPHTPPPQRKNKF